MTTFMTALMWVGLILTVFGGFIALVGILVDGLSAPGAFLCIFGVICMALSGSVQQRWWALDCERAGGQVMESHCVDPKGIIRL